MDIVAIGTGTAGARCAQLRAPYSRALPGAEGRTSRTRGELARTWEGDEPPPSRAAPLQLLTVTDNGGS
ncbi:hypothetical protein [Streptomyces sp. NBC_01262]|uniref:hypothetical protein n=1 Tax=Streptomyces sp. NBC_01262 TaxID=2903803 RepID=UPI002E319D8A|nr:hypothetical protein [Streptomyces sp. NBC_01262]